jgi:hypothetical protein
MTELAMYRRFKDAVKVPILANITEFGQTPLYTRDELGSVGVDIVLHCCSAYRAMNAAALATYQAIRRDGTQKNVVDTMQTRADLYKYLDYHAYEAKLDELFRGGSRKMTTNLGSCRFQTQEVGGPVGRDRRQYRAVHRRQDRQRPALPRLRHSRHRDALRIRRDRLLAGSREAAERARAGRVQSQAQVAARSLPPRAGRLEQLPDGSIRWTCCAPVYRRSAAAFPEAAQRIRRGARDIADRLLASLGSMLCYWYHFAQFGQAHRVETDDDSIGGHFLHLLHGRKPSAEWVRAMHTSLNLYAEHEFNASTFTARVIAGTGSDMYSCITGAIGALRGPKHGGANEVAYEIQSRYQTPDEAEADIRRRVANKGSHHRLRSSRSTRSPIRAIRSSRSLARELAQQAGR